MRANIIHITCLFVFVLVFLGMGGSEKENNDGVVSFSLWTQEGETEGVYAWIDEIADRFMNDNPDIKIELVAKDTEALREDFQTASFAGSPPELLWTVNDHAGPFTVAGLISPVDDLYDSSKFIESVVVNGNSYAVPISSGNHLMLMYNTALVEIAPKNTNELIRIGKGMTKGDSYGLVYNQVEPFWLVPWLAAFGGKVFDDDGITPTLNTPAMVSTLQFLSDLKFKHRIVPEESDYSTMDTLFKEGKAAMIVNGDWSLGDYQTALGDNFAVAPLPVSSETGEYPAPYTSGKYFMVADGVSDEVRAAIKRFIAYVTSQDVQVEMLNTFKRLPALLSILESDLVRSGDELLKNSARQVQYGTPMPSVVEMRAVWDAMKPEMNAVLAGTISPEEAAEAMQESAEAGIQSM